MPFYALSKKGAALDTWGNVIHVHAKTASDAIAHLLAGCCINRLGTHIHIQEMEVVDLTVQAEPSLPFVPPPGPQTVKPADASAQGEVTRSETQHDDITHAEVMALTGLKSQSVSDYKYRGIFTPGSAPRTTSRASVQAWLARAPVVRGNASAEGAAKMRAAKAAKRKAAKRALRAQQEQAETVTTEPKPVTGKSQRPLPGLTIDGMVRVEKLAEYLDIPEELVHSIKQRGQVAGGYGWVEFSPFMEHYKEGAE